METGYVSSYTTRKTNRNELLASQSEAGQWYFTAKSMVLEISWGTLSRGVLAMAALHGVSHGKDL